MVESERELVDEGNVISDTCSGRQVLEVCNVLLEAITRGSVRASERFLHKLGELQVGSGFDVKREKSGVEVCSKFIKRFIGHLDSRIDHLVVPHLREGDSSALTHLVEHGHDLLIIVDIDG